MLKTERGKKWHPAFISAAFMHHAFMRAAFMRAALMRVLRVSKKNPLFAFCFLGAVMGSAFFASGYRAPLIPQAEEPIAQVVSRANACQRLSEGRSLWNRLVPGTALYSGDSIMTANFSEAEIMLASGEMLKVLDNSILEIRNRKKTGMEIALAQGAAAVETGASSLAFLSGERRFLLYPHAIAEFHIVPDSGFMLFLFQGSLLMSGPGGKEVEFDECGTFCFDSGGNVSHEPMAAIVSPFSGEHIAGAAFSRIPSPQTARVIGEEAQGSRFLNARPYTVGGNNARPREIFPPDNYVTSSAFSPEMFFTWMNPHPFPAVFQISGRSDFSGDIIIEEEMRTQGSHGWFLSPGTYYWRLLLDSPLKIESVPRRLTVLPALNAPAIITPQEGENIRPREGSPVEFRWEKQNFADSYEFALFTEGRGTPLYEISSLKDTMVQVYFDPRAAGKFRWTVNAFTESGNEATRKRSLFKSNSFTIGPQGAEPFAGIARTVARTGEVHTSIALRYPRAGTSLIYNHDDPESIIWSLDEPLWNSRVLFSRNPEPAVDPKAIIRYIDEGVSSLAIPFLGEGVWYWIVEGDTRDGKGISAAAPFWFTMLPPSPLPSPRYIAPDDETVFSIEKLTEDRSITFSWEEVPGANAYIFSLFGNDEKKELIISSNPVSATSFKLSDLAILAIDDYNWQVEAVSVTRNGVIERRGIIQQYSFSMDISSSDYLRTRSQGIRYGN